MPTRARPIVLLFLLTVPGAGCSSSTPSAEAQIAADRPTVETRLAAVETLARQVAALPPTQRDAVTLAGPPFALIKQLGPPQPAANAAFLYAEDLPALGTLADVPYRIPSSTLASDCAALVRRGLAFAPEPGSAVALRRAPPPASADSAWMLLPRCRDMRYVVVIRTTTLRAPRAHREDKTFDAGKMEGDALVFDLETGALAGSFTLAAASRPEVKVRATDDAEAWIDAHFRAQIAQALAAGIMHTLPSARLN